MSDFRFVRVRNTQSTLIIVKKIFLGRQIQKVASVQKISKSGIRWDLKAQGQFPRNTYFGRCSMKKKGHDHISLRKTAYMNPSWRFTMHIYAWCMLATITGDHRLSSSKLLTKETNIQAGILISIGQHHHTPMDQTWVYISITWNAC